MFFYKKVNSAFFFSTIYAITAVEYIAKKKAANFI